MRRLPLDVVLATLVSAVGSALLAACNREPAAFELRPVVAASVRELERALTAARESDATNDPEAPERALSILRALESGGYRDGEFVADARGLGDGALPSWIAVTADRTLPAERRAAAALLIGCAGTPRALDAALAELAHESEPQVRAAAARGLGISGRDEVVPGLLQGMIVESEGWVAQEIAQALARLGNYAGLDRIRDRADPLLAEARTRNPSAQWANLQGAAHDVLARLWSSGDPQQLLALGEPSPRHRLEVWRRVAAFSSESGPAGESRNLFVLANESPWAAEILAAALHDADPRVRSGVARALARMGARGRAAGPTLVTALSEPSVAPHAAQALGAIGDDGASAALRAALRAPVTPDTRTCAASALCWLGHGNEVCATLVDALTFSSEFTADAEAALEAWLVEKDRRGNAAARDVLARWRKLAGPPGLEPDAAALVERRAQRATLVRNALETLRAQ